MDRAGSIERTLSDTVSTSEQFGTGPDLAWSPDGKKIAYNTFSPKRIARRLAVIRAGGGEPSYPLQHHAGTPFEKMMWGSDSRWLWLQSFERTRNYVLRVDTLKGDVRHFAGDVQNFWSFAVTPDVPSPLILDDYVYLCRENGNLICLDRKTGKQIYEERTNRFRHRASPVYADGKIYLSGRDGKVTVVQPGPEFKILAQNDIGESLAASPAISGGRIYLRTFDALWAFGEK